MAGVTKAEEGEFPTVDPLQSTFGGGLVGDAFVTKVDPAGFSIVFSTYLGGSEEDIGNAIAVDASGNVYAAGLTGSTDFPQLMPFSRLLVVAPLVMLL